MKSIKHGTESDNAKCYLIAEQFIDIHSASFLLHEWIDEIFRSRRFESSDVFWSETRDDGKKWRC